MKLKSTTIIIFFVIINLFSMQKISSQCSQIESILVDACDNGATPTTDEGFNEMVRFRVGGSALNVNALNVNWPSQSWEGVIQNAISLAKVTAINAQIVAAGGCGRLIEPPGGIIPANAKVILVTSYNFNIVLNGFGALAEDTYIIFQNNPTTLGGHFGNFGTSASRTLSINFGGGCSDTVTYNRSLLVDTNGVKGAENGATVNFTTSGTASYVNNGCLAPVDPFIVEAGTAPLSSCPGTVVSLSGTAQGQQLVTWSDGSAGGSFSAVNSLNTNYTINSAASGVVVLTLTATNSCGTPITDTVSLNVTSGIIPTFNLIPPVCLNATPPLLPVSSTNSTGILGTWNSVVNTSIVGPTSYIFTPNAGQCAAQGTISITVNPLPSIVSTVPNSRCGAGAVILSATASSGVVNWFSSATGGLPIGSGTSFTTPSIPTNTTYWAEAKDGSCSSSARTSVLASIVSSAPTPTVISPIQYCLNSPATVLIATPSSGATLNWYGTSATGGSASAVAPTPSTNIETTTNYYVSQTVGTCESARAIIAVKVVSDTGGKVNLFCDNSNSTATSVAFDWSNPIGWAGYTYSYSIAGGPLVTGTHISPSHFDVPVSTPGTSVTFTILSVIGLPCAISETVTCYSKCTTTITPDFPAIAPICSGSVAPILDSTSPNGIKGTWSPALVSNTIGGSYKFTPDSLLYPCATSQTLTVAITPLSNINFPLIPISICQNSVAPILPSTTSSAPLITGSWNPSIINTSVLGKVSYTYTPTAGLCANPTTVDITIIPNATPVFTTVGPICSGEIVSPLPTLSINGITGTWSPAINNTLTTTYVFTPTTGLCSTSQTLVINVNSKVTPIFASIASICQDEVIAPLPTTSINGITGNWSPAINNKLTTTYIFTPTTGLCATSQTLVVNVNSKVTPTFAAIPSICQDAVIAPLPTTSINGITGNWSPNLDNKNTTIYTFTPTNGLCATVQTLVINVISKETPIFDPIPSFCRGAILNPLPTTSINGIAGNWSPVLNNTMTTMYNFTPNIGQCATVFATTINVDSSQIPTFNAIDPLCFGTAISLPITSIEGITGNWTPSFNPTSNTTYTFKPDLGQCASNASLTVIIIPLPEVNAVPQATICSGSSTAVALTSNVVGTSFNWNAVQTNVAGATADSGNTISQTLTTVGNKSGEAVYSVIPIANGCPGLPALITITVNPIPVLTVTPASSSICSGSTTNIALSSIVGGTTFSWTTNPSGVLGSFPDTGAIIAQTLKTTATIPATVDYSITPVANGCVGLPIVSTVTVKPTPEVFGSGGTTICSGESTNINLMPNILGTDFYWTVLPNKVTGASDGSGATINQILDTQNPSSQGIVTYNITPTLDGCDGKTIAITVKVNPLPLPSLTDGIICVELATGNTFKTDELNSGLSSSNHSFEWFFEGVKINGAAGDTYAATEVGTYSVIATNTTSSCVSKESSSTVTASYPAESFIATVSDAFTSNPTIMVNVQGGTGILLYQLDQEAFQSDNVFSGVSSGTHTVRVNDTQGCTNLIQTVTVINYPKYFTPNGDGFNDTWKIVGLENQPTAVIYIFDRYGKLIKQISTTGLGWDGTLNGYELPSTDYWFSIEFLENNINKNFKAHFSLKR